VVLVLALVWSTQVQSEPPADTKNDRPAAAPESVEVVGKVVDAETGKPVEAFITQAGKFDPKRSEEGDLGVQRGAHTVG